MELLTISRENKLLRQAQEQESTINERLAQKDKQIHGLIQKLGSIQKDQEQVRKLLQSDTFKKALLRHKD